MIDSAEYSLIGSILLNPACLDQVRQVVRAEDFLIPQSRDIFLACCREVDEGRRYDQTIIENVPGIDNQYLSNIVEITVTAALADRYAQLVHERGVRAKLYGIGAELCSIPEGAPCSEAAEQAREALDAAMAGSGSSSISSEESLLQYYDRILARSSGKDVPLSTGIPALDSFCGGGFEKGGLYILGARPGVGKSSVGLTIADAIAQEHQVLYITLEMPVFQLNARRVAMHAGINISQAGGMFDVQDEGKWEKIGVITSELAKRKLCFNTTAACTVADIRLMARQVEAEAIVIDYLGLLSTEKSFKNLYEKVTDISGRLKQLALTLQVPVLAMSQLNRNAASGEPSLAELRDSGAIEQDADAVMLLYRPEQEKVHKAGEFQPLNIIIAKNRNGNTGRVMLEWNGDTGRMRDEKLQWRSWSRQ